MLKFRPELETCPVCGAKGYCHGYDSYDRYIVDYLNGSRQDNSIRIKRVECQNCGLTHAVLPDVLIPYSVYGIIFILTVLALHFSGLSDVESVCDHFGISRNLFYRWLHLWKDCKKQWLGVLEDAGTSDAGFLEHLRTEITFSSFASGFFLKTSHSFMQSHRNPVPKIKKYAHYHQQTFVPDICIVPTP